MVNQKISLTSVGSSSNVRVLPSDPTVVGTAPADGGADGYYEVGDMYESLEDTGPRDDGTAYEVIRPAKPAVRPKRPPNVN